MEKSPLEKAIDGYLNEVIDLTEAGMEDVPEDELLRMAEEANIRFRSAPDNAPNEPVEIVEKPKNIT